jgi:hypothetical protein
MSDGMASLDAMIAGLRKLPAIAEQAAAEAAPLVQAAVRATAAAGTDPYGRAWPAKKDGSRAMPDAASAVTATAHGSVVQLKVTGGYAVQNRLSGDARRQVLPDAGRLPPAILAALQEGAGRAFRKSMGT